MNKKFSTLVGGLALLGAMTVSAQTVTLPRLEGAKPVKNLVDKGLYQLTTQESGIDYVVYMKDAKSNKPGKLELVATPSHPDSLANTLWCVTVSPYIQGQRPKFDFMNKGTGMRLDVDMIGAILGAAENELSTDGVVVGGNYYGWAFSETQDVIQGDKELYSYFSKDSVVGFGIDLTNIDPTRPNDLQLVKALASNIGTANANNFTKFTLKTAPEIILNEAQINTIFKVQDADKGVNLKFSPEVNTNNPFNDKDNKFFARQVVSASVDSAKYVYILKADSSYLRVDTSFANTIGHGYLAYKWTNLKETTNKISALDSLNNSKLKAQHQFLFTYKPSIDSIRIFVSQATFQKKGAKYWSVNGDTVKYTNAKVFAQDLGSERVLTIDSLEQNVRISLGFEGCNSVENNKYSVANGLYIIKNAKDQVLAAPIHKNGTSIEWVTLDAQDPEHMPAYQWVIYQNQTAYPATSTISLTNREFAGKNAPAVQLYKDEDGVITTNDASFGLDKSALNIIPIIDSTIIKNPYLGYKHVEAEDLKVSRFKLNYLHSFNHDKWIGLKDSKDSVLYVQDDHSIFTLKKGNDKIAYGITDANLLAKVPGLAKLVRTQYVIVMNGDTLVTAAEDKYAIGSSNYGTSKVDSFYFKENNHYGEKDYYAIVRAGYVNEIADTTKKVGIADDGITNSLKVQDLKETRTSAFTVEEIDAPLYRRFAKDMPGLIEGPDTMRFIEQYRGEMLQIEGNTNFKVAGVDFLGINQDSKAPSGLSFVVDTAWVGRGLGYIKPQYLISIDRDDVKGTPFQRCAECQKLINAGKEPIKDCKHDIQATPDMNFGKYLVNFADSVAAGKMVTKDKGYNWKEYDRAGFVWAIQYGDSLYILKDQFAGTKKSDMNKALLDKIIEANKTAKNYIINLTTDKHKYATWSMRFVKPGTDNKNFLIESMKDVDHTNIYGEKTTGKYGANAYAKAEGDIAPENAAWLKMQNGCLVLSNSKTSNFNSMTGGDDALIFDIKRVADDPIATDNETVSTSEVSVIAGTGVVRIVNAEGKKVVISNILGQVIANTVIASSDATIAVPQGVVVVAVEGEEAVKAIVK